MNSNPAEGMLGIAAVERDTGLRKDTLRIWERRYGFPVPLRDNTGERLYPAEQVTRLRLVKRLMDQGFRPGKLLPLDLAALQRQAEAAGRKVGPGDTAETKATAADGGASLAERLIPFLKERAAESLRAELAHRLARDGLRRFVVDTVPALNRRIGEGWAAGEIEVFEEHLYTELLQNQLRAAIHALPQSPAGPRVLLTTLKGEEHVLGLLMAEALLAAEGAACISLGPQTPASDIIAAVARTASDVVALSFSAAYPWRVARDGLRELRAALPQNVALWAGGGVIAARAAQLPGIHCFSRIDDVPAAVAAWRERRPGPAPA
jgi:DNA-binding transcriptional MerR regulator/methylmalonyl-CoA mutase cobalamin-binding subunit